MPRGRLDPIAPSRLRLESAGETAGSPALGNAIRSRVRTYKTGIRTYRPVDTPSRIPASLCHLPALARRVRCPAVALSAAFYLDSRPSERAQHVCTCVCIACVSAIGSPLAYIFVYALVLRSSEVFARARNDLERMGGTVRSTWRPLERFTRLNAS